MSDTAAVAADTASDAPIRGTFSDSGVLSLGNSTSTNPSQNAMRSRKNISRPRAVLLVAVDLAQPAVTTAVDKAQLFALNLIRRKLAKNPADLIRCKFSIDGGFRSRSNSSTISKPYPVRSGNPPFTICTE